MIYGPTHSSNRERERDRETRNQTENESDSERKGDICVYFRRLIFVSAFKALQRDTKNHRSEQNHFKCCIPGLSLLIVKLIENCVTLINWEFHKKLGFNRNFYLTAKNL